MPLKNRDFISIDFLGKVKDSGEIFDLTKEEDAKKHHLHNPQKTYGPLTICIGERHVVEGLDEFLIGKETGKTYTIAVPTEKAFGKRNPKLLRLVPMSTFHEHKIRPEPGLHINLDGMLATVRSVSGGRVILDFNHPLAGKDVEYEISIHSQITDIQEKLKTLITYLMPGLPHTLKENTLHIDVAFPEQMQKMLTEKITTLIPEIKTVTYKAPEASEKQAPAAAQAKKKAKSAPEATKV